MSSAKPYSDMELNLALTGPPFGPEVSERMRATLAQRDAEIERLRKGRDECAANWREAAEAETRLRGLLERALKQDLAIRHFGDGSPSDDLRADIDKELDQ